MNENAYDVVLYHDNCSDGWCAAWIASRACPDAKLIPVQYGQPVPSDLMDARVLVVDFSYKRRQMLELAAAASELIVLDHHKTAQEDLEGLAEEADQIYGSKVTVVFDMMKSGARLAWEHFHPDRHHAPALVCYVEDRDLWRWSLPESKEINAAIGSYPRTAEAWQDLHDWCSTRLGKLAQEGAAILRYQAQVVASHIKNAVEVQIDTHMVLCCNATVLMSEIGQELAQSRPFGATYFTRSDGKRVFSLRSTKDGIDVSEVAKKFGGGGHQHAAGFEI